MKPTIKFGLFVAPLAALVVALATLLWAPGTGGAFHSSVRGHAPLHDPFALTSGPALVQNPQQKGDMVELEVKDVIPIEEADTHAVVLVSKDQQVLLPIFVTEEGAVSIAFRLAQRKSPHPLAADLLDDVVTQMGGKVKEVRIDNVQDDVYTSHVIIDQKGKDLSIEARPSDAIAMALTGKAKITCKREVLAQAGITKQEIDKLRQHMKEEGQLGVGGSGDEGTDEGDLPPGIEEQPTDHGEVTVPRDGSNIRL